MTWITDKLVALFESNWRVVTGAPTFVVLLCLLSGVLAFLLAKCMLGEQLKTLTARVDLQKDRADESENQRRILEQKFAQVQTERDQKSAELSKMQELARTLKLTLKKSRKPVANPTQAQRGELVEQIFTERPAVDYAHPITRIALNVQEQSDTHSFAVLTERVLWLLQAPPWKSYSLADIEAELDGAPFLKLFNAIQTLLEARIVEVDPEAGEARYRSVKQHAKQETQNGN